VIEEVVSEVVESVVEESMEEEAAVDVEAIVKEIADALQTEMGKMKEKMAELEVKVKEMESLPAAEATIVKPSETGYNKSKFSTFDSSKAKNASRIEMEIAAIKNRKK